MPYNEALHYRGNEPYIFIAGCQEDSGLIVPILEKLAKDHRVWFAREDAFPREDTDTIARRILDSAGCIAFITAKAAGRHNFRREICYALEKSKSFLAVYLEQAELPPGLEMELSDVKSLAYPEYLGQEQLFFFHIRMTDFVIASQILYYPSAPPAGGINGGGLDPVKTIPPLGVHEPDTIPPDGVPTIPPVFEGGSTAPGEKELPRDFPPMYLMPVEAAPEEMDDTLLQPLPKRAWLVRSRTGEEIPLAEESLCLGRSPEECGYAVTGNSAISKRHTRIFRREGCFYALDLESFNHTYVNDIALQPELPMLLRDGDRIRLANEGFVFHQTAEAGQ